MGKKLSNDYRIWIETATPGTFAEILGNQNLSISRSGSTFSTGGKSDFPYDPQAPGARSVSVQASFVPDLPDANGYGRLMTLARATSATPIGVQIRKGGSAGSGSDKVFECSMYVTQDDNDMNQNTAVGANLTFVAAAAPTTDLLA